MLGTALELGEGCAIRRSIDEKDVFQEKFVITEVKKLKQEKNRRDEILTGVQSKDLGIGTALMDEVWSGEKSPDPNKKEDLQDDKQYKEGFKGLEQDKDSTRIKGQKSRRYRINRTEEQRIVDLKINNINNNKKKSSKNNKGSKKKKNNTSIKD
ncbi:hypothetical protein BY996DRAFT_6525362 [Phakopsora pachyrhizi]|nr:hypothetical protein BY996DRAFT_6525362 [Phakopsora pachyrhizi]